MYVKIDRNYCGHHAAKCERCLGRFLENPYGYERRCFVEIKEDGSDLLTLDITTNGNELHLNLDEDARMMLAGEGWLKVVELAEMLGPPA